jgi:hypothetical protein
LAAHREHITFAPFTAPDRLSVLDYAGVTANETDPWDEHGERRSFWDR